MIRAIQCTTCFITKLMLVESLARHFLCLRICMQRTLLCTKYLWYGGSFMTSKEEDCCRSTFCFHNQSLSVEFSVEEVPFHPFAKIVWPYVSLLQHKLLPAIWNQTRAASVSGIHVNSKENWCPQCWNSINVMSCWIWSWMHPPRFWYEHHRTSQHMKTFSAMQQIVLTIWQTRTKK